MVAWAAIASCVGALIFAATLPTLYAGNSVVAFVPRPGIDVDSDDAVEITMPAYTARAQAPSTISAIALEVDVPAGDLADGLELQYETESSTMMIEVQLPSPADAADAANAIAAFILEEADDDPLIEPEVVSRALPDGDPDAPRRGLMGIAALGAGAVMGSAAAVYLELTNRQLRSPSDVPRSLGLRVLGTIPQSRVFRTPTRALAHPTVGAAFRTLRTNLLRSLTEERPVIVVTSPEQGAGKSLISALLAESLARLGKRVLLIDTDLYRPTLARKFKLDAHRSLAAALRGTIPLQTAIKRGWADGLWVVPTKSDKEAGDLISARLPDLLREAAERFDIVILDAAPIRGTAEGKLVASMTDGVLFVIRRGTEEGQVIDALGALETLRIPVIGTVVNGVPGDLEADYDFG
jgi:capsular exopolysaccharide synthesis family protein